MCCKLNNSCCTLQTGTTIAVIFYLVRTVTLNASRLLKKDLEKMHSLLRLP